MTRPILLLTSETPVRLSWLTETSPFTSVMGANLNRANTAACNCTLSTGEDCDCEAAPASECITSRGRGRFQALKPLPNKYALLSDAYNFYKAVERSALSKVTRGL